MLRRLHSFRLSAAYPGEKKPFSNQHTHRAVPQHLVLRSSPSVTGRKLLVCSIDKMGSGVEVHKPQIEGKMAQQLQHKRYGDLIWDL